MVSPIKEILDRKIKRRTFLKGAAATAVGVALFGSGRLVKVSEAEAAEVAQKEGKWVSATCWHNCGGRCVNYAYVVDGVVIRQKTDDTHSDTPDFPQQRSCARGRAQRHQIFGKDRLKYPMKRKHWASGGGDKSLRGKDEWVRISWDEALDIVASEIKRVTQKYGDRAIFVGGGGEIKRTLDLYGSGYVSHWGTASYGSWLYTGPAIGIGHPWVVDGISDRFEFRKSQLIVIWGGNSVWSSGGNPSYHYLQAKKAGVKFIFIDPYYSESAATLADEWIPIRPGTDHAMLLGMAYTLITEDDPVNNPLIDWDFLNRCTVGFDKDHMPADATENFKDYVLGLDENGNLAPEGHKNYPAKTPEWASQICGVDPQRIRSLAIEIGSIKRVALLTAWAAARIHNGDSWPQMFVTFGCMTGHIGKAGSMTGVSCHRHAADGGPALVKWGGSGVPGIPAVYPSAGLYGHHQNSINDNEMWDAVLTGKYTAGKDDIRDINIQLIYHDGVATLQTREDINKGIAAHRKVEFIVNVSHFLTTNAKYSDIVLPATTQWERYGYTSSSYANREMITVGFKVTEPLCEARDDIWIAKEIGKRLGLDPNVIDPMPLKQQVFNQIAGAKVIKSDGSEYEPLVTITAADIAGEGVGGEPQSGRISYKEFKEKGFYQVPRSPGDALGYIFAKEFRDDPEANPRPTASGKFEIHCQTIADLVESRGWTTIRPIPTYNPAVEGYENTFIDWKNKVKGAFPLQLYTIHYPRRCHSIFDNIPWLREAFPNEFFMNPVDAAERGIEEGDTVLITSRHGKTIRPVYLTERMMPGVVTLPHGAWVEMDEETGIDKAGADNIINGAIPTGQGISGWNTCHVQVEKYVGPIKLKPDWKWPQRIPIKEEN